MYIHYQIELIKKQDLARVELWYSKGWHNKWVLYDYDLDRTSPIQFIAPGEGIYRFIVVAVDRWGRKSCGQSTNQQTPLPAEFLDSIPPQQIVFVDYTPPKLYLLNPRGTVTYPHGQTLEIQWQGFDQNLADHPVTLFYQKSGNPDWTPISQSLPAEGKFPWTLPERLSGSIIIKAQIEDQAGNQDAALSSPIHIVSKSPDQPPTVSGISSLPNPADAPFSSGAASAQSVIPSVTAEPSRQDLTQALFRKGNLCRERQDLPEAAYAYEQALQLDPNCFEARVNLANIYYMLGKLEDAVRHFEICLQQKPSHPTAMFNLAKTQLALNQFEKAESTLDHLLAQNRRDWWAWLMRGDAAEKLGKPNDALSSWRQAAAGDLSAVKEQARQRIANYTP